MFGEDALAERLTLHKLHGFNPAQPASGEAEAADTAEGVDHAETHGFRVESPRLSWQPSTARHGSYRCGGGPNGLGLGFRLATATGTGSPRILAMAMASSFRTSP